MQHEVWKPVLGFEGLYEVSNIGRVRSLLFNKVRYLRPLGKQHQIVGLWKRKKHHSKSLHVLVLEAFVGKCPHGYVCRHFPDANPTNNRLINLAWGTRSENENDKIVHGTSNHGIRNGQAKLTLEAIQEIRKSQKSYKLLAEEYKVNRSQISRVKTKTTWKEV